MHEVVDGIDALLGGGPEHGHHPALGDGTAVAAVPTAHLARDCRWAYPLLSAPTGRVDRRVGEEREQRVDVAVEVVDEFAVLVMRVGLPGEQFDAFGEIGDGVAAFGLGPVSRGECFTEELANVAWCRTGRCWEALDQFVGPSTQMGQTCLMGRLVELVVDDPAVMNQCAVVVGIDECGGVIETAAGSTV